MIINTIPLQLIPTIIKQINKRQIDTQIVKTRRHYEITLNYKSPIKHERITLNTLTYYKLKSTNQNIIENTYKHHKTNQPIIKTLLNKIILNKLKQNTIKICLHYINNHIIIYYGSNSIKLGDKNICISSIKISKIISYNDPNLMTIIDDYLDK